MKRLERIETCSNPQSISGKYFMNMKNPDDIVMLIGPANNIFYCYTEAEFQRILNEDPPAVIQAPKEGASHVPVSIRRQMDPARTFWVYKTEVFGYIDKSLYDCYMAGSKTFKIIPSNKTVLIFKNAHGVGVIHDYPAKVNSVVPIDRDIFLILGQEKQVQQRQESDEIKHQEIKANTSQNREVSDILPNEEDDLLDEREMREFLKQSEKEREEVLKIKREAKKKEDEELKKIIEKRAEGMKVKIEEMKRRGGFQEVKDVNVFAAVLQDNAEGDDEWYQAVRRGDLDEFKQWVDDMGIDVHDDNEKALNLACRYGHLPTVRYLIEEKHADVQNNTLGPPLTWAVIHNHIAVVKYLTTIPGILVEPGVLNVAAEKGYLEILKYMVEDMKMDPHMNDEEPLVSACTYGHLPVVRYLVEEQKADVRVRNDTPLVSAYNCGIVAYLISKGVDVNARNSFAMRFAAEKGSLETVKYLVQKGSHIQAGMRIAYEQGDWDIYNYLAQVETADSDVEVDDEFTREYEDQYSPTV